MTDVSLVCGSAFGATGTTCDQPIRFGHVACERCGRPVTREDRATLQARLEGGDFVIIAGGAVYFSVVRWLGIPIIRISDSIDAVHWPAWTVYATSAVAPGVLEELTFRGYLMDHLDRMLTLKETLLVQAALFAVLHLGLVIFPSHFGMGLVLGTIRRRSRSLYPGMATHAGWNALVIWCERAGLELP